MFKFKDEDIVVSERSNVIQYDMMGYPLRLVIMSDGTQQWLDTLEKENDVILEWTKVKQTK